MGNGRNFTWSFEKCQLMSKDSKSLDKDKNI